jgi:hypothetical protein
MLLSLEGDRTPSSVVEKALGPPCWLPNSQEFVTNFDDVAPRDYLGQVYWPLEVGKRRFGLAGNVLATIPVPPPYDAYDVSPDGRWLAMHWDTHCSETAAQLFRSQFDGSELQPIARRRFQYYWYPRFRPDGAAVLAKHLSAHGGQLSVRVIELDGSAEQDIALGDGYAPDAACWSPKGNLMAIAALHEEGLEGGPKHSKLFVVNAAGTHVKELSLAGAERVWIYSVDWTASRLVTD